MKKILCFTLAFLLLFNTITCNVFAEDFSGSSTDYEYPSNAKPITDSPEYKDTQKNINTVMKAFFSAVLPEHASELWSDEISSLVESESIKDNNVTTDGNYYYINANFIKNINEKVQENIHALDGYWLIETSGTPPFIDNGASFINYCTLVANFTGEKGILSSATRNESLANANAVATFFPNVDSSNSNGIYKKYYAIGKDFTGFDSEYYMVLDSSNYIVRAAAYYGKNYGAKWYNGNSYLGETWFNYDRYNIFTYSQNLEWTLEKLQSTPWSGSPFRVFYSLEDLNRFKANGGRQYYAPKLPFSNIRIPVTYINNINNSGLPDFNFNLGSLVGKAEADVQADIDLALKNYLDHLIELNNNKPAPTSTPTPTKAPSPTKAPTSTPAPATPITVTPTPVLPNVTVSPTPPPEDFSSINKWLEQIYNWLLDFGDKHETFTEKICTYIDSTDGKLDQIIEAIDRLSQGDTTGEANGCKYDYTALSEFMTQLWNESDKKFDKMVELLEENNEYQQKIVDSLNQIKALLVADTVLDVFRNRSNETANKAKEKFPTSLPWDIALVVNAFSAPPKEPVIELPIKIESMHIDEKIVVDLSSEEWVKLAKTCRYLLSILFVLYMVHLSRKFFSKGDD